MFYFYFFDSCRNVSTGSPRWRVWVCLFQFLIDICSFLVQEVVICKRVITESDIRLFLPVIGRISGVMDDRGKYIYISQEEMQAVADYIKRQGRVSISHLASKSNQFIDLEPKAQFVEEISSTEEITVS